MSDYSSESDFDTTNRITDETTEATETTAKANTATATTETTIAPTTPTASAGPDVVELQRHVDERMIAGVCAGIGRRFGLSIAVVRIVFVAATLLGLGSAILIYLACWVIMPKRVEPNAG